jgi:hypothetical protein
VTESKDYASESCYITFFAENKIYLVRMTLFLCSFHFLGEESRKVVVESRIDSYDRNNCQNRSGSVVFCGFGSNVVCLNFTNALSMLASLQS